MEIVDSLTSLPSSFPPVIEFRHKPEDKGKENKKVSQLQKITSLCMNNGITFLSWIERDSQNFFFSSLI